MAITLQLAADGPTKRQILDMAFGDIAMAGYEFGRTPEEVSDALLRLNALMREWPFSGLLYNQPFYGVGDPADASGIPFDALNAVALTLAHRLASVMGKTMPAEALARMAQSVSVLRAQYATIPTMPRDANTPRGLGGMRGQIGRRPFINEEYESPDPVLTPPSAS